jgi:MscS family membrane protein
VGDLLKVQEVNGTVEKIGLRSTRIRTTERTYLTIPNKQMVDSIVDNLSLRNKRRFEMVLALDPRSTVDQLKKVLKEMEEKMNYPDLEEKTILLSDIRIDSYTVTIECITGVISIADFNALKQKLNFEVLYLLETNGIAVAGKERLINTTLKS